MMKGAFYCIIVDKENKVMAFNKDVGEIQYCDGFLLPAQVYESTEAYKYIRLSKRNRKRRGLDTEPVRLLLTLV